MRVSIMRTGISFVVSPSDRLRLEAVVGDRNARQKHVWRCRIVLLTADGTGASAIMRIAGVSKTAVWRWQERFMTSGVDGLLRDKTRPPRIAPLGAEAIDRVVALTLADPPGETTHWTADMMAKASGISASAVRRIWIAGVSKTAVWRWQDRFMTTGVDGMLRDKTRPPRIAPLGAEAIDRVVALTLADPPGETTHWTADMMAKASGISASAVRRIWKAHGLQPHRYRQFKLSSDPKFATKLHDVVGLYVDPPAQPSFCQLMKRARSRRSTAPSRACC